MSSWQQYKLGELAEVKHGFAFEGTGFKECGKYSLLTPKNFFETGGFRKLNTSQKYYDGAVPSRWVLKPGDVLIALTEQAPGLLGASVRIPNEGLWLHNQRMGLIDIKNPKRLAANYLYHWFNWSPVRQTIFETASGTKVRHSAPSQIHALKMALPTIAEQLQVAVVLDECDIAIDTYGELLTTLELRKQGLMQQLLTGRRRLKGFKGQWQEHQLGHIFEEVTRTSTKELPVMTISAGRGFLTQSERFNRIQAGKNLENYIALREGEFAYNKGNSKTYQCGCVYMLKGRSQAAVPNVYIAFKAKLALCPAFYAFYFEADLLKQQLQQIINSGVRNDGLLNLNGKDFFRMKLPMPEIDEQKAIAEVLKTVTEELNVLKDQLELRKAQKRALMQKLLSEQWRMPAKAVKGKKS